MKTNEKIIGYLKYSGETIQDGLFDARNAGNALIGFDEIIRHFMIAQNPNFQEKDFNLLVRIEEGSWKIVLITAVIVYGTTYVKETAKVAARDGVAHTGLVKDVKSALFHAIEFIEDKKKEEQQNEFINHVPQNLFTKNVEIVDEDISMEIGVYGDNGKIIERVRITKKDRYIFISNTKDIDPRSM